MGLKHVVNDSGVSETKKVSMPLTMAKKLDIILRCETCKRFKDICAAMN
jgi:hypothetical protein